MRISLLILFILTVSSPGFSQRTTPKIRYYSPREYGKGREATNNACIQDKAGVLYFGNAGGVLQYDGVNWSFIPVKNQSVWVQSLAVSDDNTVFVGAQGEFGYLAPGKTGKLYYVSLSDSLPDSQMPFSDIIRVLAWKNQVIFQAQEAIFLYSGGELIPIYPQTSFYVASLVSDELYVRQRGIGVMKLSGKNLELVSGSEYLRDIGVFSILESSDPDKNIIVTPLDGFWYVNRETFEGELIKTNDSIIFRESEIYGAIKLDDERIAVNTLLNGIIITDETFRVMSVINKENGLKVNGVNSLLQDYQGNIWAGLENGIAQIFYYSPLSVFGPESGISGNVKAIIRYNGILFTGTTEGLFVQNNDYKNLSDAFIPFRGLSTEIRGLCLADNRLLAGTRDALFEIEKNKLRKIVNAEINALYYSDEMNILFVSVKGNMLLFKYSEGWKKFREIPEITEEIVRFEEEINEDNVTLWMGTPLQGIVRLRYYRPDNFKIDRYDSFDGLIDNDWIFPFRFENKVIFSQRNGLMAFVDEMEIWKQLPDSMKDQPPDFYKGYFDIYSLDTTRERISKPFYFIEDTDTRIYVNLDGELGYFDKADSCSFVDQPFRLEDVGKINVIYHEENGVCWMGGNDGLLMFSENSTRDYHTGFNALVTSVSIGGRDSVIYHGNAQKSAAKPEIKHYLNTFTFTFAAPFFEGQDDMLYSYMLSGQDTVYSSWGTDNSVVIGNLWEGDYAFRVKAMNVYGHLSNEAVYEFRVLSPWYRKPCVYLIYIVLFLASVYVVIRIYARHLIAKNKRLEAVIRDRTREIQAKNAELQMQKEDILASINYAQRIQTAVLPSDDFVQSWLGDHFVIYRPKDIVSGDFYWTNVCSHYVIFCVADCTGHGVPGAFMSMLCISFLNEVVIKEKVFHPDKILNKVRNMIIESLKQKGLRGEQKDGMDIAICVFNKETAELEFAGANNPLYIIRKKDKDSISSDRQFENEDHILYELRGDRMPISIFDTMEPFKRRSANLQKEDRLYMFSDGIVDQFGGPSGKKFTNKALVSILMETITPEMKDQKRLLEENIDKWQAFTDPRTKQAYSQIDDICIMGIII